MGKARSLLFPVAGATKEIFTSKGHEFCSKGFQRGRAPKRIKVQKSSYEKKRYSLLDLGISKQLLLQRARVNLY